jgi:ribosomal protein S24E
MEIKKDIKNEIMQRREIQAVAESGKTPSFAEASKMVSEQFKSPEENIMVENVKGKFGRSTFLIKASIYDTKELKDESFKRLTKPKKAKPGEAQA